MCAKDKDFFYRLFLCTSIYSSANYQAQFINRLPQVLLETALASAPEIEDCDNFDKLVDFFFNSSGIDNLWKNSELYPYLNYLCLPKNKKNQLCVDSLLVHCGILRLTTDTNPEVKIWRLFSSGSTVVIFNDDKPRFKPELTWEVNFNNCKVRVFRPYPNLFDDIDPLNYGDQNSNLSNECLNTLILNAFDVIENYSSPLFKRIVNQLSTIAILKEQVSRPLSYSHRNLFIGTIFITPASSIEMAEQIIHEYYHQSIWPWWLVEPPKDLPGTNIKIKSPVTGAERSLPTMIQAVLIYASLIDFYDFIEATSIDNCNSKEVDKIRARAYVLNSNYAKLVKKMDSKLNLMPASLTLLNNILDVQNEVKSELIS